MKQVFCFILFSFLATSIYNLAAQGFTSVERYTDLSGKHKIHAIVVDNEDNKYVGTSEGLFKIAHTSNLLKPVQKGDQVTHLAWDRKSGLWAVKNGRTVYQPLADRSFTFDEEGLIITCIDASATVLYIGTNRGLKRVGLDDDQIEERRSKADQLLENTPINNIYVDPSRVRWIGTDEGVFRLEYNKKINHYEKNSRITSMTYTSEGVWIVGDEEMWLVDNYNRWAPAAVDRGLRNGSVTAMAADKSGRVYLASEGLVQFNPYADEAYTLDKSYGFVNATSTALACDKQDQVWVGTADQGLFKIKIKTDKPVQLSAVVAIVKKLDCADDTDGEIKVVANGANGPIDIEWLDKDVLGETRSDLGPGLYKVVVRDSTGQNYEAETTLSAPERIEIFIKNKSMTQPGRKRGTVTVEIKGGVGPYDVQWSGGQKGTFAEKLSAGEHLVTVVDNNGCLEKREIEVEEEKLLAGLQVDKLSVGSTLSIEQLFFDADSSKIKEQSFFVLDEIYGFLNQNESIVIEIGGHTNNIPEHEYCDRLSNARAKSVAEYLYQKGIREKRISFKGYGKRKPIATNATKAGRQKNQRVEIKVLSMGD